MKKLWIGLFAVLMAVGQAPAWALSCAQRCMPGASLACVRACAKSAALLTHNGQRASVGQTCASVQVRLSPATLPSVTAPKIFTATTCVGVGSPRPAPVLAMASAGLTLAHAPPTSRPAQILLSVPVAQAPPAQA